MLFDVLFLRYPTVTNQVLPNQLRTAPPAPEIIIITRHTQTCLGMLQRIRDEQSRRGVLALMFLLQTTVLAAEYTSEG